MTRKAAPRRPRHRQGRGALVVIVALFAGSGLIRLGEGAIAIARTADAEVIIDPETCAPPDDVAALLEALGERAARLAAREAELDDRAQAISVASAQIDQKIADLVAAEDRLAATLTLADEAAEDDVARLTAMYEAMKPKDAAPLFEEMAPDFAAGFLGRMRPDAAGALLAALEPKTAYTISVLLAGRNAAAPGQ
ncbi:hypothetical protein GVY41_14380 [Frigidibacter albus]|uniref:Magnesium transporter MgtE intracellular domain-containing protein n=1 Tax=Frigidibacter albus TaxID=1465486 RepID=A0A6L8VIV3_9RHOB|nr:hypothetical protein [Frigidibacter albus]MZQ90317.1 hypothetical protein [Frigidibacter albus]NBE32185.1 hypothetical protein [Frigidibacter albus]GGH58727.1 hypothetical protein GCM10011341_29350 [Frigidibacter albus]